MNPLPVLPTREWTEGAGRPDEMELKLPWNLNARCAQIAQLVAEGFTDKQVADAIGSTFSSVKVYLSRDIYPALGVSSRAQLTRWWIENVEQRGNCSTCTLRRAHGYANAA